MSVFHNELECQLQNILGLGCYPLLKINDPRNGQQTRHESFLPTSSYSDLLQASKNTLEHYSNVKLKHRRSHPIQRDVFPMVIPFRVAFDHYILSFKHIFLSKNLEKNIIR